MKVTFGQQTTKVKQLADLLSQEISMGKYKSDCTLPSINKLSREYQVSRDTVFKAFIDLKGSDLAQGVEQLRQEADALDQSISIFTV